MQRFIVLLLILTAGPQTSAAAQEAPLRPPIIDVHLHAYSAADWTSRPANPVTGQPAPSEADDHMRATLAAMEKYNIVAAVVSGPLDAVEAWRQAAPERVLGSPLFGRPGFDDAGRPLPGLDSLQRLYESGRLRAMAEVTAQYEGLSPSDMALDPYFALAAEWTSRSASTPVPAFRAPPTPGSRTSASPRGIRSSWRICSYGIPGCECTSCTAARRSVARPYC